MAGASVALRLEPENIGEPQRVGAGILRPLLPSLILGKCSATFLGITHFLLDNSLVLEEAHLYLPMLFALEGVLL